MAEVVSCLIQSGADVAAQDNYTIRQAAVDQNIEMLKLLIANEKIKNLTKQKGNFNLKLPFLLVLHEESTT